MAAIEVTFLLLVGLFVAAIFLDVAFGSVLFFVSRKRENTGAHIRANPLQPTGAIYVEGQLSAEQVRVLKEAWRKAFGANA